MHTEGGAGFKDVAAGLIDLHVKQFSCHKCCDIICQLFLEFLLSIVCHDVYCVIVPQSMLLD